MQKINLNASINGLQLLLLALINEKAFILSNEKRNEENLQDVESLINQIKEEIKRISPSETKPAF